ncbi:hypothetical protein PanWU01x14_335680, partial [Parasponia andersonii]
MRVDDQKVKFNVFKPMKLNDDIEDCYKVDIYDNLVMETFETSYVRDQLEDTVLNGSSVASKKAREYLHTLNMFPSLDKVNIQFEALDRPTEANPTIKPSIEVSPIIELKPLPGHLKYVFL